MPFLSRRALEGLKAYKYKPGGYTILDKLHNPFWNCKPAYEVAIIIAPGAAAGMAYGSMWMLCMQG